MPRLSFALVLLVLLSACNGAAEAQRERAVVPPNEPERVPGQYIIRLAEGANLDEAVAAFAHLNVVKVERVTRQFYLLEVREDPGVAAMRKIAGGVAAIENIDPNYIMRIQQ